MSSGTGGSAGFRDPVLDYRPEKVAFFVAAYAVGILGNAAALAVLRRACGRRYVLLLRFLAVNDTTALAGMLAVLVGRRLQVPGASLWWCEATVLLRGFGLGSGCVNLVMAVERYFTLTRPFTSRKWVTRRRVWLGLAATWGSGVLLSWLPLLGFGLYRDANGCRRYKEATTPMDVIYAYIFCAYGAAVCIAIVSCSLAVRTELSAKALIPMPFPISALDVLEAERIRASHRSKELAFSRLMAIISVSFVVCWTPQIVSVPVAQAWPGRSQVWERLADLLILLHFISNPFVYVLLRSRGTTANGSNATATTADSYASSPRQLASSSFN